MRPPSYRWLAGVLGGASVVHFARPITFDALIPSVLPGSARAWTYASGAAELAVAAAVAHPRTRRRGELAAAILFVAVFPGNVKMALDASGTPERVLSYARLPFQVPLVGWALALHRSHPNSYQDRGEPLPSTDAAHTDPAPGAGPT